MGRRAGFLCGFVHDAGLLGICAAVTIQSATAQITTFDPQNSVDTEPQSIDAKGSVTGYYYKHSQGNGHGFFLFSYGTIPSFVSCGA